MKSNNERSSKHYSKFTYYDKYKKDMIYFIMIMSFLTVFLSIVSRCDIRIESDFLSKMVILIITMISFIAAHIITKKTCYHEGSFYFKGNNAVIILENETHTISKDSVKKVKFISRKNWRAFDGFYFLKVYYENKVCRIRLSRNMYNNKKQEEINIYEIYKFLKTEK